MISSMTTIIPVPLLLRRTGGGGVIRRGAAAAFANNNDTTWGIPFLRDRRTRPSPTTNFSALCRWYSHLSQQQPQQQSPPTNTASTLSSSSCFSTATSNGTTAGPVIRFRNVSFGYNPEIHLLLDEVDFSISAGSKVTIMGQNGSGKSTITKLITQQIPRASLSNGQIIIRHKETIGYAMQTVPVNCRSLTIDQFLYYQLTGIIPKPDLFDRPITDNEYDEDEDEDDDDDSSDSSDSTMVGEPDTDMINDNNNDNTGADALIMPRHEFLSKKGKVLKAVQLHHVLAPSNNSSNSKDRVVSTLSGGQQARLLLAAALIQKPSILILDEPTNNMDQNGLEHLQNFIATSEQTCIVISHDEAFLNSFTDMVLYLDIHSKKVESYMGDYFYVKSEISKRIERENAENARKLRKAQKKKEQANKFANKGGNLRKVAKTMREVAAEEEESIVDVRREDVSLSNFVIPFTQPYDFNGKLLTISHITGYNQSIPLANSILLRKGSKLHLCGPNGIGKSTFLEGIVARTAPGVLFESSRPEDCRIGYYRQDFFNFDFSKTVMQWMEQVSNHHHDSGELYQIAAKFLLRGTNIMKQPIGTLSEGQKGLLSFACLYILQPTILIVDEPTNHINFRHIPAIVHALSNFDGALIIVSHDQEFIQQIGPFEAVIDMGQEFQNTAAAVTAGSSNSNNADDKKRSASIKSTAAV